MPSTGKILDKVTNEKTRMKFNIEVKIGFKGKKAHLISLSQL